MVELEYEESVGALCLGEEVTEMRVMDGLATYFLDIDLHDTIQTLPSSLYLSTELNML